LKSAFIVLLILEAILLTPYVRGLENIDFQMSKYESSDSGFNIELTIINNSQKKYWLHLSAGQSLIKTDGNILYFAPNSSFYLYYYTSAIITEMDVLELYPNQIVKRNFYYELHGLKNVSIEEGEITSTEKQDFSELDYINIFLVFFDYEVMIPIEFFDYNRTIVTRGIVVSKIFKIY
jgi:hypothetical protein